ncbi:MAG: hypothetical protein V7707_13690 [Motiliproteus sp.]
MIGNQTIGLVILALLAAAASAAEPSYLPGGEEVKKAVEARRGKTELSKLAASMAPGQWAELKHEMPKHIWSAPPPSKGLHIGTWSDDGHWDSRTGQFLYFGVRQTRKLIAYSEETNTWRNIPFDGVTNAPVLKQKFGHQYSMNSFDPERSRLYTGHTGFDVLTETWFQPKATNKAIGSSAMCYEYFTAMDGIVSIGRKPKSGTLRMLSIKENAWKNLGRIPVHGYHSMGRHNPFREEVLFAGGNNIRTVGILTKDGKFKQMKDFPLAVDKFTIRSSTVTVDPLSGRYMFMVPGKKFVEFDSEKNEYRLIDDFSKTKWPFYHYDGTVTAFIPEYGVTFWADRKKVHLYKHKLSKGEPLPDAPPPAVPAK